MPVTLAHLGNLLSAPPISLGIITENYLIALTAYKEDLPFYAMCCAHLPGYWTADLPSKSMWGLGHGIHSEHSKQTKLHMIISQTFIES